MDNLYKRHRYNYELPEGLIAQQPKSQRDQSRLLLANRQQVLGHHTFADIVDLLPSDTLLVLNNSKVIASRLFGKTVHGGKIELFLLEPTSDEHTWKCLAKPLKKIKEGMKIHFSGDYFADVISRPPAKAEDVPTIEIRLFTGECPVADWLEQHGIVPLPPYIERTQPKAFKDSIDSETYQTVYAEESGSAAAPTAGLHFTEPLLARLMQRGVTCALTTLHVGSGTFLPVKSDDIRTHHMHSERYSIPKHTVEALIDAKADGRPIVAVGTTSLRSLEAFALETAGAVDNMRELADTPLRTDLFIHPREDTPYHDPHFATGMITNFHQPESSLIMLVSALMGTKQIKDVYQEAVKQEYRFFSYGDACLFWFEP